MAWVNKLDNHTRESWDTDTFGGYLELLLNEPEYVYPQSLSHYTHDEEKSELQSWISHHTSSQIKMRQIEQIHDMILPVLQRSNNGPRITSSVSKVLWSKQEKDNLHGSVQHIPPEVV